MLEKLKEIFINAFINDSRIEKKIDFVLTNKEARSELANLLFSIEELQQKSIESLLSSSIQLSEIKLPLSKNQVIIGYRDAFKKAVNCLTSYQSEDKEQLSNLDSIIDITAKAFPEDNNQAKQAIIELVKNIKNPQQPADSQKEIKEQPQSSQISIKPIPALLELSKAIKSFSDQFSDHLFSINLKNAADQIKENSSNPKQELAKLAIAVLKARITIASESSKKLRNKKTILDQLDKIKNQLLLETRINDIIAVKNQQQLDKVQFKNGNINEEKSSFEVSSIISAIRQSANQTFSDQPKAVTQLFRSITDKNVKLPETFKDNENAKTYVKLYKLIWNTSEKGLPDPEKLYKNIPAMKETTNSLPNKQNVLSEIEKLGDKAYPYTAEARLNNLLKDMEQMITPKYNKVRFRSIGYDKAGLFSEAFKKLARRHSIREHQVGFLTKLRTEVQKRFNENKNNENNENKITAQQGIEILAAGLKKISVDIEQEYKNKFTSKLKTINDHLLDKYCKKDDISNGMKPLEEFILSDLTEYNDSSLFWSASDANFNTETIKETSCLI